MPTRHVETHRIHRAGWLRAAVLGANDGLMSTASLMVGVAEGQAGRSMVLLAGLAALVAGAASMAAGEYISVSSQADLERADLARERSELAESPETELAELTRIYVKRGLDEALARQVATALTKKDALGAHARDELGITDETQAKPLQAALASAASFVAGAVVPIGVALVAGRAASSLAMAVVTIAGLALLGAMAAKLGASSPIRGMLRALVWGALALALSTAVGRLVGVAPP